MMQRSFFLNVLAVALLCSTGLTWAADPRPGSVIMKLPTDKLVELARDANAPIVERALACRRLGAIGTKDAVPAVAALLSDAKLNIYARQALEGISDPSALDALRDSAKTLRGPQLAGVLESLGAKRDTAAIDLLVSYLDDKDVAAASAAARALGRIATQESVKPLVQSLSQRPTLRTATLDALLIGAGRMAASSKPSDIDTAVAVYKRLADENADGNAKDTEIPKHVRIAAMSAIMRIPGRDETARMLSLLRSTDKDYFRVGLAAAAGMSGAGVAAALTAEFEKLPAEKQALVMVALGDRNDVPLPFVLATVRSGKSPEVRKAAVDGLAKLHGPEAAASLLALAMSNDAMSAAAAQALRNTLNVAVDATIVDQLSKASNKDKTLLFKLVGDRAIQAAKPAMIQSLNDADPAVQAAALDAIGNIANASDFQTLLDLAFTVRGQSPKKALRLLALRMADRETVAAKIAGQSLGASPENVKLALSLLGDVGGKTALQIVAAAARSTDPAVKNEATRALGVWATADAAPFLLDIAKNDSEDKYRTRALRGYIRIARRMPMPPNARLDAFRSAMTIAKRDGEKRLALGVAAVAATPESLQVLLPFLANASLKSAAADALVEVAGKIVQQQPQAVHTAMEAVVKAGVSGKSGDRAKQLFDQTKGAAKN